MQSKKSHVHYLFNLFIVTCLASGILGNAPAIVHASIARADPPPPLPEEIEAKRAEQQQTMDTQPSSSPPATSPVTHTIHLKSRQIQPTAMDELEVQSLERLARSDQERIHVLVQLDFIPRQTAREELEARGLELLAYVPDYAWIASVPADNPAAVLELPGVTWADALTTDDKLDPTIKDDLWGNWNLAPDGTAAVYVVMHQDEDLDTGYELVEAHDGKVVGEVIGIQMLVVEMPKDNVRALAAEDAVQWVEPAAPPLGDANDGIRPQIGVDTVNAAPYNLDGTGVDVMVYDGGQVGDHVDFGSRLTHGDADSVSEHSTHVAGTVGGNGANSTTHSGSALQWRGMAPEADLISYGTAYPGTGEVLFYEDVPDIEADWAVAQNVHGADIGTASLGANVYWNYPYRCDVMGRYGPSSRLLDQIVRGGNSTVGIGDKYITTWAVGNERGWGASCGTYNIVAPPAAAKNPIQVGGSNTDDNTQYAHTSWGPTEDGRIKPIVTAGACQTSGDYGIKSTDDNPVDAYTTMCGTSMATPAVAGGIALMLQHYRDVYNTTGNFWPSTAKAILMQTADDFGNPGPDYQWGYGQVDIHAAVDLISRKAFRQESIAQGEVDVYYFIVPDDATPATVSLAWDDYEATLNANPTLINNLDLELVAPDGTLWQPWVLNAVYPANNATRGTDNRNNQEQVQVFAADEDIVGTWLVRVRGTSVPQGPQDYSLVCEGCQPLNLGVCQSEVGGTMMSLSLPESQGPTPETKDPIQVPQEESFTAGELWQQSLEIQASPQTADEKAQTQASLAAFEVARETGPEAIAALIDTLTPEALDLLDEEIAEAQERLAESAPPPPETGPVSAAEEQAALKAQQATEAANRARTLTHLNNQAENQTQPEIQNPRNFGGTPARPAADLTVGNGCTYATIADAIAVANPGDTLLIEGGRTFIENLTIPISLTLQGGYDGCASGSTARTTIDGSGSNRVIYIFAELNVTLENLNLTNGYTGMEGGGIRFAAGLGAGSLNLNNVDIYDSTAQWGGGLWVGPDAEVMGVNVEIYDNTATVSGGGVRLYGARATFSNSSNIRNNSAPYGGGVYASQENGHTPQLNLPSSSDVLENQALTGNGLGGGIYVREGSVSLADCSDLSNNDAIQGGGAFLITSTLTIDGYCSKILYNEATGNGGGVYAQGSTINLDDDAWLYYNAAGTDGSGSGGGAYLDDSDLYSDRGSIGYNTAGSFGGGVYATNSSIVDMSLGSYTCLGSNCSQLSSNTATNYGGGIYAFNSTIYLNNTFVKSNTGQLGGGIYAWESNVYAYNNLFARNNATSTSGDGVRLYTGSSMNGTGNTLAYNNAGGAATGRAIDLFIADLTLSCSIIWGHTSSINLTGQDVTYSDIQDDYAGTGNLNVNPLFVSAASQDYHLQNSSPVIDRCLSGSSPDFDNERRPIVRVTAATPYDMGADEVSGIDRVGLNGGGCAYGTIQQAINAASDGDTIQVAAGVYFENVDVIDKDVTIAGDYDSTCTTTGGGTTRIEGSAVSGSTLDVQDGTVSLSNIDIAWGSSIGGGLDARSGAQVTLDNVDVFNNHGTYGGGIYVDGGSTVTADNGSEIHNNTASSYGGGARVWGQFFGYTDDSDIHDNCAPDGGGFSVPGGSLYLNNADVYLNDAADTDGKGGGIHVATGGIVTITNGTYVYYLNRAYDGAGIYADDATISLSPNTTLRDNVATHYGGGVYLTNNSALYSDRANIGQAGSALANEAQSGAGLYVDNSTATFDGGRIINNIAAASGGGIYATDSTLYLTGVTVGGTGSYEANQVGVIGAGLYFDNTQATLSNTVVASNTFQSTFGALGGGAYLANGSDLILTNSRVERHRAWASIGYGAGICASDSTVTLDNSHVTSNTAYIRGGGVYMDGTSTLNVLNGSSINNNESANAEGGGIVASGTSDVNISDSTLQNNTAGTDGGAVYLIGGTLDFTGWWDVRWNHADGNGGAVAVLGTGDVDFDADGGTSYLGGNSALGSGGALYVANNDWVYLNALDGHTILFNTNSSTGNGGAAFADNNAFFIANGQIQAISNNTGGNGGIFYLDGGSDLYLLGSADAVPQITGNQADSGGAIYTAGGGVILCIGAELGGTSNGNTALAGSGGAIYSSGSTLLALNCTFRNEQATGNGGAIAAYTSTVSIGADYSACAPLSEQCSSFYSNTANGYGGAIYTNDSTLLVNRTYLHRNSALLGGAIYQVGVSAVGQVENSLIYSNTVSSAAGAGIRVNQGVFTVTHTTITSNTNAPGYSASGGTSNAAINSIAWDNSGGGFAGTFVITSCNIDQGGNVGIVADPQFVAPGTGEDYHLISSSPAVDQCATGLTPDLDNATRPVGSNYDMGAYEYPYAIEFTPDNTGNGLPSSQVVYIHVLTNVGGLADTYALTTQSGHGWPVAVTPSPTVTLNVGQSVPVTVTISIPSGVPSGTVDTTTVTATSGSDPSLAASVVDTTTIGFAPGAVFEPDYVTTGAGESDSFIYTHTLTNTGNAQDTFYLTFNTSAGWGSLLTSSPIVLNQNQSASVIVTVTVPTGGSGLSDTSLVTATSAGGAEVVVRDITSAFNPGVAFTPDYAETVSPDITLIHTHTLTNTGDSADTFYLTPFSTLGWGTLLDTGPFTLLPDETETVRVRVVVPPGSAGMTDSTIVTATSAGGADPVAVQDTTEVYAAGVTFVPNYTQTIPAGDALTYTHRLTNSGAGPDTIDVGVASSSEGWTTLVDAGPFVLNAGEGADVRVRVDAPFGTGGLTDVAVVTATSRAGSLSGVSAAVTDTTSAIRTYGVALAPDYVRSIPPSDAITYTHWLTNTGNGTDKFGLLFDSSQHWATLMDVGPFKLEAGEAISVHVHVEVPPGSGGLTDIATIVATSDLSPTFSAQVTDMTTGTYTPSMELIPDYDQTTTPGSTFTHTHWLTNTGNGSDQFNLDFSSSQGWATLLDPGPFTLNAGKGITLQAYVDVPLGSGGLTDIAVITATAQSGGLSATATDTTTVPLIPGIEIGPDQAESVVPDDTYIYIHILENTGNGSDTFNVTMSSSLGWGTLLNPGPFTLDAGETTPVQVSVHVPSGLISGTLTDVTVVTATSQAAPALSDTATDTTTVGFAPGMTFTPDHLVTGASASTTYNYTHTLTNLGNYTDTFDLDLDSSAGWGSLLTPGPFELAFNESTIVQVSVTVPSDGDGKFDTTVVTATSQGGAGPVTVQDTTAAFNPSVAFAPNRTQTLEPGDAFTYTHTLTNTGDSTDTLKLNLDSSRGWTTLLDAGPFILPMDGFTTVRVRVDAPAGSGGLTDVTTVTAATLAGAGPAASVLDTTSVNYTPGIELSPDQAQTVPAGSAVIYTHQLTNTGNGPDTFTVTLHSDQGWSTLLTPVPLELIAGQVTDIDVEVTVPTDTYALAVDVTTITATALLGGVFDAASDTTTVLCEPLIGANFTFAPPIAQTGQSVAFTGTVTIGSAPFTYMWDLGDESGVETGNPIWHTFTTTGTFTVVMTVTNICPSMVTATHTISVIPSEISTIYLPLVMRDYGP